MQHNLKATSSLNEWLSYLENSHFKAIDLGLERIKTVARELDLLRPAPYVITVGGTNGKGTTCRLLETILINAGYKVGVYSSPHLIRYNERVRIQNQELTDLQHAESFAFINEHKSQSLTYFEFGTLSALYLFKQAKIDVAILEVGLGGRLDATNIVDADMAVITSVDIDHVDFLGDTREKIGFEKAGIFRTGKPVIIGEPDCPHSMLEYAASLKCAVSRRNIDWSFIRQTKSWTWQSADEKGIKVRLENLPFCRIPLPNAATVLAAVQALPFDISESIIRQSLQEAELDGRFQTVNPARLSALAQLADKTAGELPRVIIDVGHNPHAARYLSEKLTALHAQISGRIIAVCGILNDKDTTGVLKPILPVINEWVCVTLAGERGQTGASLNQKLQALNPDVRTEVCQSVREGITSAVKKSGKNDVIIVFGSFHTVGEFLQLL